MTEGTIWTILQDVKDPEIPTVSLVEMGMVNKVSVANGLVNIEVLPTFVGCPALEIMKRNIVEKLTPVDGITEVQVKFVFEPAWSSDRITEVGREKLTAFGIAPPPQSDLLQLEEIWEVTCPFCGSEKTRMDNLFGPAACRSILYCEQCKNPFEAMKPV
ncbi:1,2-phenylacetyl-CoA epoxidase subunit PaaD [Tumebacillus permanentifrigoris]|uniref:Ring-1,2-phenylacetyl-CoA epoxidase subunit PaaD n=1 Tax=Tumebacillus permanentifrigoris TaxID=378543 RepID=A0A316D4N1_9BACL|nr:1,2-phenylacetyl-CoA epoxidase subunit PaaD [Tumebacillus permanentifrigoris]PWK07423.1 ring-1,2-phenylacetyl-CoA epoxidase subunit PaaD [Tumebacillus permanentifrigoris]